MYASTSLGSALHVERYCRIVPSRSTSPGLRQAAQLIRRPGRPNAFDVAPSDTPRS